MKDQFFSLEFKQGFRDFMMMIRNDFAIFWGLLDIQIIKINILISCKEVKKVVYLTCLPFVELSSEVLMNESE